MDDVLQEAYAKALRGLPRPRGGTGRSGKLMTDRSHYRDEVLGAALRELPVPEHRAGFERELQELLARKATPSYRPWVFAGAVGAVLVAVTLVLVLTRAS